MPGLSEIVPEGLPRVMDLVRDAGVDIGDWSNFRGGERKAASNPKYCYEWSFIEPGKVVVLNRWRASMREQNGTVVEEFNMREVAHQFG